MSKFELKIDTDNDAFRENYIDEIEKVFKHIIESLIDSDYLEAKWSNVRDTNGNTIGAYRVTDHD